MKLLTAYARQQSNQGVPMFIDPWRLVSPRRASTYMRRSRGVPVGTESKERLRIYKTDQHEHRTNVIANYTPS